MLTVTPLDSRATSEPPVVNCTSSKASKSKYDGEEIAAMSVMLTPSTAQVVSSELAPAATNTDCWPLSLPPTLMRSVCTPGVWRQQRPGVARRRDLLQLQVSLIVAPVVIWRSSSSGDSAVTVMTSWIAAFSVSCRLVLWLALTETFG